MADFTIKQNDTGPSFRQLLKFPDGSVVPLASATVKFVMRDRSTGMVKVNTAATVEDVPTAAVRWDPLAADTATPGDYDAEWHVFPSGGGRISVPDGGPVGLSPYLHVRVNPQLGP